MNTKQFYWRPRLISPQRTNNLPCWVTSHQTEIAPWNPLSPDVHSHAVYCAPQFHSQSSLFYCNKGPEINAAAHRPSTREDEAIKQPTAATLIAATRCISCNFIIQLDCFLRFGLSLVAATLWSDVAMSGGPFSQFICAHMHNDSAAAAHTLLCVCVCIMWRYLTRHRTQFCIMRAAVCGWNNWDISLRILAEMIMWKNVPGTELEQFGDPSLEIFALAVQIGPFLRPHIHVADFLRSARGLIRNYGA